MKNLRTVESLQQLIAASFSIFKIQIHFKQGAAGGKKWTKRVQMEFHSTR
jgi:hypothetical protein